MEQRDGAAPEPPLSLPRRVIELVAQVLSMGINADQAAADALTRILAATDADPIRFTLVVAAPEVELERVERYARAICRAEGMDPDGCLEGSPDWMYREPEARAAIALADAEAVERAKGPAWEEWVRLRDDYVQACEPFAPVPAPPARAIRELTLLDAFVARLTARMEDKR